jgi:hypothetical protein
VRDIPASSGARRPSRPHRHVLAGREVDACAQHHRPDAECAARGVLRGVPRPGPGPRARRSSRSRPPCALEVRAELPRQRLRGSRRSNRAGSTTRLPPRRAAGSARGRGASFWRLARFESAEVLLLVRRRASATSRTRRGGAAVPRAPGFRPPGSSAQREVVPSRARPSLRRRAGLGLRERKQTRPIRLMGTSGVGERAPSIRRPRRSRMTSTRDRSPSAQRAGRSISARIDSAIHSGSP